MQAEIVTSVFESTETSDNNRSVTFSAATLSLWQPEISPLIKVLDTSQLILTIVGFFANMITVITLVKNGKVFSPAILLLLRHQSLVDSWACGIGAILLLQVPMWATGNHSFDIFVCHVWHGQGVYWGVVFISIWNLVLFAFERHLAVCHPFKHNRLTTHKIILILVVIYVLSIVVNVGSYLQTRLVNGTCISEFVIQGSVGANFFYGYVISIFFNYFCIPFVFFVVLYGMVIAALYRRRKQSNLATSRVIDKATNDLTHTAIVVTVIFIVSLGYDCWYYLLGYTGVTEYVMNSPLQKMGVWFATFNSVANPFVYAMLMPAYRRCLQVTFCWRCTTSPPNHPTQSRDTGTSSVSDQSAGDPRCAEKHI